MHGQALWSAARAVQTYIYYHFVLYSKLQKIGSAYRSRKIIGVRKSAPGGGALSEDRDGSEQMLDLVLEPLQKAGAPAEDKHYQQEGDEHGRGDQQRAEEVAGIVAAVDIGLFEAEDDEEDKADDRHGEEQVEPEIRPGAERLVLVGKIGCRHGRGPRNI